MNTGMYILLVIIIVLVVLILGLGVYFLTKYKRQRNTEELSEQETGQVSNDVLKEKIDQTTKTLDTLLTSANTSDKKFIEDLTTLKNNLSSLIQTIDKDNKEVKDNLTRKDEKFNQSYQEVLVKLTNIITSTNNIEDVRNKLANLNNVFLNNNKSRGNLGEYLLEKMLSDLYGETNQFWQAQYRLKDNNIVDAVIKTTDDSEDIVIDSKFPLTNYNNYINAEEKVNKDIYKKQFKTDVKNKVDEVTKYINPTNKITNAIMFIPSEEIFAFVYSQFPDEVINYAYKKHVWITSPTTLTAILFTLDRQNSELKLNKNLEEIKENLLKLKVQFDRWSSRWNTIKDKLEQVNKGVKDLDITQNKIQRNYENIYTSHELGEGW